MLSVFTFDMVIHGFIYKFCYDIQSLSLVLSSVNVIANNIQTRKNNIQRKFEKKNN